jgi:hypothetical protein
LLVLALLGAVGMLVSLGQITNGCKFDDCVDAVNANLDEDVGLSVKA